MTPRQDFQPGNHVAPTVAEPGLADFQRETHRDAVRIAWTSS